MYQLTSQPFTPFTIQSDYHSMNYSNPDIDDWMYTNSTKVSISYSYSRFGQSELKNYYHSESSGLKFKCKNFLKLKFCTCPFLAQTNVKSHVKMSYVKMY